MSEKREPCSTCRGVGYRHTRVPLPHRSMAEYLEDAERGTPMGKVVEPQVCTHCGGTGYVVVV